MSLIYDKIVVFSDIHGNLSALEAVLDDVYSRYKPDAFACLGDLVDYGMRSNEVIQKLVQLDIPMIINLQGNHEKAILDSDLSSFSSNRGRQILLYTKQHLSNASFHYIHNYMNTASVVLNLLGKKILFVHGDIENPYWGKLTIDKMCDDRYNEYDYVISGHTHKPHAIENFCKIDLPDLRNQKKTIFINPGSVGQPRNLNPYAQYAYFEISSGVIHLNAVQYDVAKEQSLFPKEIDAFYKERLLKGI